MQSVRLDLTRGVKAALNELAEAAKARTPVRSCGLRASCRVRVTGVRDWKYIWVSGEYLWMRLTVRVTYSSALSSFSPI